jgi:hypothetical protein
LVKKENKVHELERYNELNAAIVKIEERLK